MVGAVFVKETDHRVIFIFRQTFHEHQLIFSVKPALTQKEIKVSADLGELAFTEFIENPDGRVAGERIMKFVRETKPYADFFVIFHESSLLDLLGY